jgi:cell shape-determining protein MreC
MKKDMIEYCNALKETARQKESDNTDALTKQQLLSRIRKLEAENYMLKQRLSEDDWK